MLLMYSEFPVCSLRLESGQLQGQGKVYLLEPNRILINSKVNFYTPGFWNLY